MPEMSLIAEHFVIVGAGCLIAVVTAAELEALAPTVCVHTPTPVCSATC
jgi:hypothetical protein